MLQVTRTLTVAEVLAMNATPIEIIRAPGAGKILLPQFFVLELFSTGHTPFAAGSAINFGTPAVADIMSLDATHLTSATDEFGWTSTLQIDGVAPADLQNQALSLRAAGSAFTGGTGCIVTVTVGYCIV